MLVTAFFINIQKDFGRRIKEAAQKYVPSAWLKILKSNPLLPDGRYALFVLIAGQLALLGNFIEWAQARTSAPQGI